MPRDFRQAVNDLDEKRFQLLYGRCDTLEPAAVAALFMDSPPVRWHIAGGRAARVGAEEARPDRPKDRADLAAARLDPAGRVWLVATLERLGHDDWARRARDGERSASPAGPGFVARPLS